ncbi:MAG TPA: tetratricopeptide repeat protein [candidate division Zixibacteria bacterium]|nr:tetratricopeptide repeat protein [candidate division Zixibacteria bacterium]
MAKGNKRKATRTSTKSTASAKTRKPKSSSKGELTLNQLLAVVRANPDDVGAALTLADHYRRHGQEPKIADVLEPLADQSTTLSIQQQSMFCALLSYSYAITNRFIEAERIIEQGLTVDADSPDLLYVLTYLKLHLKEYQRTTEAGASFRNALDSLDRTASEGRYFATTPSHLSQTRNFVANAYRELRDVESARNWYEQSIAADPANHLPYLNLTTMLISSGDSKAAGVWTKRGLKNCREVQELRMLARSLEKTFTVSACMIVKDEEKMLPGCLASIRDWVDEIILVDTGSTDNTVKIAEEYGAKIFHRKWTGDFSAARNYSLEQATGDWVLIIDADERFVEEDIARTRQLLGEGKHEIISINVFNVYGENEETTTFLPSIRLFRRSLNLRYEGIVHNRLELPQDVPVARAPIRIKHHGYDLTPEEMHRKFLRSKALLEKQLTENPDNVFALFNYAQLLRGEGSDFQRKNAPQILKAAGHAVELTDPKDIQHRHTHLMCLDQIAWTHFYLGNNDLALEYADRALSVKPDYLDPLMLRGHAFGKKRQYQAASEAYLKYIEMQSAFDPGKEVDNIILVHPDSRATAYFGLAMLAELQNDRAAAIKYYLKTLEINSSYLEANGMLGRIYLSEGNPEKARPYLMEQLRLTPSSGDYLLEIAKVFEQTNQVEKASEAYGQALKADSESSEVLIAYAEFCARRGNEKEVEALVSNLLADGGRPTQSLSDLASTCLRVGFYRQAAGIYSDLGSRMTLSAEHLNDLGNCYFKMGEFEEAEVWYLKGLEAPSPPAIIHRNLGLTQVRLRKNAEAVKTLAHYADLNPKDQAVVQVVGDLYTQLGNPAEAINFYERTLKANPEDALALFGLSDCYLNMGHADSAILGYQRVLRIDPDFEPARQRLNQLAGAEVRA